MQEPINYKCDSCGKRADRASADEWWQTWVTEGGWIQALKFRDRVDGALQHGNGHACSATCLGRMVEGFAYTVQKERWRLLA